MKDPLKHRTLLEKEGNADFLVSSRAFPQSVLRIYSSKLAVPDPISVPNTCVYTGIWKPKSRNQYDIAKVRMRTIRNR